MRPLCRYLWNTSDRPLRILPSLRKLQPFYFCSTIDVNSGCAKSSVREIWNFRDFRQTRSRERAHIGGRQRERNKNMQSPWTRCAGFWPDLALPPISISLNDDRRACTRARVTLARRHTRVCVSSKPRRARARVWNGERRREIHKKVLCPHRLAVGPLPPPGPSPTPPLSRSRPTKSAYERNVRTPRIPPPTLALRPPPSLSYQPLATTKDLYFDRRPINGRRARVLHASAVTARPIGTCVDSHFGPYGCCAHVHRPSLPFVFAASRAPRRV